MSKQPYIAPHGGYVCPECGGELAGDGENHIICMECDYQIHESEVEA